MNDIEKDQKVDETHKSATDILRTKGLLHPTGDNNLNPNEDAKVLNWMKDVAEEEAEWDAVEKLKNPVAGTVITADDIDFNEAFEHFNVQSFPSKNKLMNTKHSRITRFIRWLFGPRPINKGLRKERDLLFNIAHISIDNNNQIHCRVLQMVYKKLTRSRHNCPRFGSHWEVIGFQGNDPGTDLRGAGFLALLHLLYLVTDYSSLAADIYQLSLHPEQNFPFCLVSINVTRIALQALRTDKLSDMCNKRRQVVEVMNEFYVALYWYIYQIWKNEMKTMQDSGHVLKAAEMFALNNANVLIKNMQTSYKKPTQHCSLAKSGMIEKLSIASSLSERSLQLPALSHTPQSLEIVLQPTEHKHSPVNQRFTGVLELAKEVS